MIIYDLEIEKAIPNKDGSKLEGIQYCEGWHDHANMGVSVLCARDNNTGRTRVFCEDNKAEFLALIAKPENHPLVSFNGIGFDNKVIKAVWGVVIPDEWCYDILVAIWAAHGLGPQFVFPSHIGFGLDDCIKANSLDAGKSGSGALAPVDWQRGKIGSVIDYCIHDVTLTEKLLNQIITFGSIVSPKTRSRVEIKVPEILNG